MSFSVQDISVQGKTFIVFGLARSGLAAVQWLVAQGACVYAFDADSSKQQEAVALGALMIEPDQLDWSTITAVVQSPGISPQQNLSQHALHHGVPLITDCNLLRMANPEAQFVGITGTNGKSTTTTLVGHILQQAGHDIAVGGNVGVAALSLPALSERGIYVLELSSYQLELSGPLSLSVAAWLNISEDHLARHGNMAAYIAAKKRIFLNQMRSTSKGIIGVDDDWSEAVYQELLGAGLDVLPVSCQRVLSFGIFVRDHVLVDALEELPQEILYLDQLERLPGLHNEQNCAVAYGVCRHLGLEPHEIIQGLRSFPGLAHRQELIASVNGVRFINDSKATNADAAAKALATFDHIYWILGGEDKTDGIDSLTPYFNKIQQAFLIGAAQHRFGATLAGKVPFMCSGDLPTAVRQAYEAARCHASHSPIVLLSPACASFDQFKNFEERGNIFRDLVRQLEQEAC